MAWRDKRSSHLRHGRSPRQGHPTSATPIARHDRPPPLQPHSPPVTAGQLPRPSSSTTRVHDAVQSSDQEHKKQRAQHGQTINQRMKKAIVLTLLVCQKTETRLSNYTCDVAGRVGLSWVFCWRKMTFYFGGPHIMRPI